MRPKEEIKDLEAEVTLTSAEVRLLALMCMAAEPKQPPENYGIVRGIARKFIEAGDAVKVKAVEEFGLGGAEAYAEQVLAAYPVAPLREGKPGDIPLEDTVRAWDSLKPDTAGSASRGAQEDGDASLRELVESSGLVTWDELAGLAGRLGDYALEEFLVHAVTRDERGAALDTGIIRGMFVGLWCDGVMVGLRHARAMGLGG